MRKKKLIRCLCFIVILAVSLLTLNRIFKMKYGDGIYSMTRFYEQDKNTVDVLVLGSSHAFENINTEVLWEDYGMAAYVLGGSLQPMWNTYYYLKEALKTQTPELIVLEGYMTIWDEEYMDDSRIIKNTFGLKWSLDRINAIKVSAPKERWTEFLLGYTQYHSRYEEITKEDFCKNLGDDFYRDWKGFFCNTDTQPQEAIDITGVTQRQELMNKTEVYYRKTIELAQKNNIPIAVVISPYAGITEEQQRMYLTAQDIAKEYGVEFVNFNLNIGEIGIDYQTDAADADHLNLSGDQKYTAFLADYLKENYSISDRRGDKRYESWERQAEYVRTAGLPD